ncbi:hypothetical protein EEL30_20050 [Brevibacillus laterosporus]|uniref:Uncharacterized protein n=1 Tax=Brevibacillus laterosporus TaxID=1465 RepID=A0A518VBL3_BRELA|nr:hypothetical protein EEL30_20050 [Brevibacillus laterosporus]
MKFKLLTFVLLLSLISQIALTPFQAFATSDELPTIHMSETEKESTCLDQSSEEGTPPDCTTTVLPTESEISEDIESKEQVSKDATDSIEKDPEIDTSKDTTVLEEEEITVDDFKNRIKRAAASVKEETTVHKGETIVFESDDTVSISSDASSSKKTFFNYVKYDAAGVFVEFFDNSSSGKSLKGRMIVTVISDEPVTFKYPLGVKVTFSSSPALRTVELGLNESYTFTNTSDIKFFVKSNGGTKSPSPKYDFALYDSEDNLIKSLVAQGSQSGGIAIKPGEKIVVTTISGDSIRFSAPFEMTSGDYSDEPALIRKELSFGESLTLTNANNKSINLHTDASTKNPYQYAKYKSDGAAGLINLKYTTNASVSAGETIVVSPSTSEPVSFIYHPLNFLNEDESDPPFYEQILHKGESYYFDNLSEFPLDLKEIRVATSDKFDYKLFDENGNFVKEVVNTSVAPKLPPYNRVLISNVSNNPITIYSHYRYLSSTDSSEPALERIPLRNGETIELLNISEKTQKIQTDMSKKNDNLPSMVYYKPDGSFDTFEYLWGSALGSSATSKSISSNGKLVLSGISQNPATIIYNKDNFSVNYVKNKDALTYKKLSQGESFTFYNPTNYVSRIKAFGEKENTKYSYTLYHSDGTVKEYTGFISSPYLPAHSRITITLLSEEPFIFYGPAEHIRETDNSIPTFHTLELNSSQPLIQENSDSLYYKFTTSKSGLHRLFTDAIGINNTDIKVYEDPQLTKLITESAENITIGYSHYKKAETLFRGNQTYYVQITGASTSSRITLEEDFDSTPQDATLATLNAIYDFDLSSVFDIDYYRYVLTESSQLNIILPKGIATIENGNGDILKTIVAGSDDTVFIPENPGVYFVKQQLSPEEPQYRAKRSIGSDKGKFAVKDLTPIPMFKTITSIPGKKDPVKFKWRYLSPHTTTVFEVYEKRNKTKGKLVYKDVRTDLFQANKDYFFLWDGYVNQTGSGTHAQNGRYVVSIYASDAQMFKYEADVMVLNNKDMELDADTLIDVYNKRIPSEKISRMQTYLKSIQFYEGEITGHYDYEFLVSVMAYENVINKWGLHVARDVYIYDMGYLSETGEVNDRLLGYAYTDASLGHSKYSEFTQLMLEGDSIILSFAEPSLPLGYFGTLIGKSGSKIIKKTGELITKTGKLSNGVLSHLTKRHVFNKVKDEIPFLLRKMTREKVEIIISGTSKKPRSYFNKEWSNKQVEDAVQFAFDDALKKGKTNGIHDVEYLGEKITIYIREGVPNTAYGSQRYSLKDFGY